MPGQKPQHWRKTWTENQQYFWFDRIEFLLDALPFEKEIQIRRIPMRKNCGDCEDLGEYYRIRISNTIPYITAIDTLLEELAHALEPNDWDHGSAFHDALRRIRRAAEAYEDDRDYSEES